jgi:uncharacterized membrane protein
LIFGWQHFIYADYIATLIPAWMPARLFLAYFTGCAFITAGTAIITNIQARLSATLLGFMFLLWVVLLHGSRCAASPYNKDECTSLFVALALGGGSFVVALAMSKSRPDAATPPDPSAVQPQATACRQTLLLGRRKAIK